MKHLVTVTVACTLTSMVWTGCTRNPVSVRNVTSTSEATLGAAVFAKNCAACHGASGEGGIGPSLKNERSRKNYAAAVTSIKEPLPTMPKLYPSVIDEKDVDDVAAFVEAL